ncbi:MAG: hypothetical protein Ta2D_03180 [Rickettsiales bacterium]|nr:MAG: hypothetical protein Ta2D_03180 [Rickettsiales bacterium]
MELKKLNENVGQERMALNFYTEKNNALEKDYENFMGQKLSDIERLKKLGWGKTKQDKQLLKELEKEYKKFQNERKDVANKISKINKKIKNLDDKIQSEKKKSIEAAKKFEASMQAKNKSVALKQVEQEFKGKTKIKPTGCKLLGEGTEGYVFEVVYFDKKEKKEKKVVVKKSKYYNNDSFFDSARQQMAIEGDDVQKYVNQKGIIQPVLNDYNFLVTKSAGNISLEKLLQTKKIDMNSIPRIMNDLYSGMNNIHASDLLQGDFATRNMVVDTETNKAKLVDLGGMQHVNKPKFDENGKKIIDQVGIDKESIFLFKIFKQCLANSFYGPVNADKSNRDQIDDLIESSNVNVFSLYIENARVDGLLSKEEAEEIRKDFQTEKDFIKSDKIENVFNVLNTRIKNRTRENKKEISYKGVQRAKDVLRKIKHLDNTNLITK